jgi:hypothetical protein
VVLAGVGMNGNAGAGMRDFAHVDAHHRVSGLQLQHG